MIVSWVGHPVQRHVCAIQVNGGGACPNTERGAERQGVTRRAADRNRPAGIRGSGIRKRERCSGTRIGQLVNPDGVIAGGWPSEAARRKSPVRVRAQADRRATGHRDCRTPAHRGAPLVFKRARRDRRGALVGIAARERQRADAVLGQRA